MVSWVVFGTQRRKIDVHCDRWKQILYNIKLQRGPFGKEAGKQSEC